MIVGEKKHQGHTCVILLNGGGRENGGTDHVYPKRKRVQLRQRCREALAEEAWLKTGRKGGGKSYASRLDCRAIKKTTVFGPWRIGAAENVQERNKKAVKSIKLVKKNTNESCLEGAEGIDR